MVHPANEMSDPLNGNGNGSGHGSAGVLPPPAAKKPAARTPAPAPSVKESRVSFKVAEGGELRGTLVRMTRHVVFFELYNPGFLPRLSEALEGFKIIFQERVIYAGRAVVRNLLDAETKIICEATLDEATWADVNLESVLAQELVEWRK